MLERILHLKNMSNRDFLKSNYPSLNPIIRIPANLNSSRSNYIEQCSPLETSQLWNIFLCNREYFNFQSYVIHFLIRLILFVEIILQSAYRRPKYNISFIIKYVILYLYF